jgi:hypothetical protein
VSVTIRARLPKSDQNGLSHLEGNFAANPDDIVVVIGLVRADTIEDRPHDDDNPRLVKTVLLHVEAVIGDGDIAKVDKLLRAVYAKRTGKRQLPFEENGDTAEDNDDGG